MAVVYSQNDEDVVIADYFGDFVGKLLDIGANDGITFSNSRRLIEKGWQGVLVEPSLAFGKLSTLYFNNLNITCINIGISDKESTEVWYELQDSLLATKNKALADSWKVPYTEVTAMFKPYSAIADKYDFINIDAEGEDWVILQQIDLTNVKCLCIEYGIYDNEILAYCAKYGMKLLHKNFENMIFVR